MKITRNQIYIGLGLAVLAYLYFRRNKGGDFPTTFNNKIQIRNAGGSGAGDWYAIKTKDRKSQKDTNFDVGTKGLVNGNQRCTISKLKKEEGRITAFKCEELAPGSYNVSDPSGFEY